MFGISFFLYDPKIPKALSTGPELSRPRTARTGVDEFLAGRRLELLARRDGMETLAPKRNPKRRPKLDMFELEGSRKLDKVFTEELVSFLGVFVFLFSFYLSLSLSPVGGVFGFSSGRGRILHGLSMQNCSNRSFLDYLPHLD